MPLATTTYGALNDISDCMIMIPGASAITFNVLPEISDTKSAHYNDEPVIGRSFPIKTFANGDNRSINMKIHLITLKQEDILKNMTTLRAIQSLAYPQSAGGGSPYKPPPIAQLKCGDLFTVANGGFVCVVLKSYSVSFPTDVVWDSGSGGIAGTMLPLKFDIDCQWDVVFSPTTLPGSEFIMGDIL